jgi:hypothetical protein
MLQRISEHIIKECPRCGEKGLYFSFPLYKKMNLSPDESEFVFYNDRRICCLCVIQLRTRFYLKKLPQGVI